MAPEIAWDVAYYVARESRAGHVPLYAAALSAGIIAAIAFWSIRK